MINGLRGWPRRALDLIPSWVIAVLAQLYAEREMAVFGWVVAGGLTLVMLVVELFQYRKAQQFHQRMARLDAEEALAQARWDQEAARYAEQSLAQPEVEWDAESDPLEVEAAERQQAEQIYWSQYAEARRS